LTRKKISFFDLLSEETLRHELLPFLTEQDYFHLLEAYNFSLPIHRKLHSSKLLSCLVLLVSHSLKPVLKQARFDDYIASMEFMKYVLFDVCRLAEPHLVLRFIHQYENTLRDNLAIVRENVKGIPSKNKVLQTGDKYEKEQGIQTTQELLQLVLEKKNAFN
jgi:hypothetical protein